MSATAARIYLDHNATTPCCAEALAEMTRVQEEAFANPGSRHVLGRVARKVLETSRERIAELLQADPAEVVFTSGGTEANNFAVLGTTSCAPAGLVTTAGEHPSVAEPCRLRQRQGWTIHNLPVEGTGRLEPAAWEQIPWSTVRSMAVILAQNETGVIQDVSPLIELAGRHGVPCHLDAVQAVGKIPVRFHDVGASTLSLAAHKFHGPRGVGAVLIRKGCRLAPLLRGGHQEAERRAGTEPVALIAGMACALELAQRQLEERAQRLRALRDRLEHGLLQAWPKAVVNGAGVTRLPNTLNIAFPGVEGEALLVALDLEGVCCSLGSTCASGSAEPAPALVAMGCRDEVLRSAIRFSVGITNTVEEIDLAIARSTVALRQQQPCS